MAEPTTSSPPLAAESPPTQSAPTQTSPVTVQDATEIIEAIDFQPEEDDDDDDSAVENRDSTFTASISSSIVKYRTVNGRTYHSDSIGDNYWGSNDEAQNNLLDIGHHLFTLLLDGDLYLAPLKTPIERCLDLGTGTGCWAIDFADAHPETEVIGTDISPIQPTWVPPNLKFMIDDFNNPWLFPENHFDFIHIRWVPGTVHNWTSLFKQAYRALKPGGWLQAFDTDGCYYSDDGTMTETTATAKWKHIVSEGGKKMGLKARFFTASDDLMRPAIYAAGFTNIYEKFFKGPYSEWPKDPKLKEIGLYHRAMVDSDTEGMIGRLADAAGYTREETIVYCSLVRKEMRSLNVHAYFPAKLVYGQKPEI